MSWLVTGGAGYIGAHVVRELQRGGAEVVVFDDLSSGVSRRIPSDVRLVEGSVLDTSKVIRTLRDHRVDGVVHLAGRKAVAESVAHPLEYYRQNVQGMHSLLSAMVHASVPRILFSSSAAVYGATATGVVTETTPTSPMSPYGWTKLVAEEMLRQAAHAHQLSWAALRYFNVAGAGSDELADGCTNNLIPQVFRALDAGLPPQVFGTGYNTPDGTCVRDYVHVADLATAHTRVVRRLEKAPLNEVFNVGTGRGSSVLEVLAAVRRATGWPGDWELAPARPGDPATVVADAQKIRTTLGWTPQHDLDDVVQSAWRAWTATPATAVL